MAESLKQYHTNLFPSIQVYEYDVSMVVYLILCIAIAFMYLYINLCMYTMCNLYCTVEIVSTYVG